MKVKIVSNDTSFDLSSSEVMQKFNTELSGSFGWSFSPETKILDIEASEENIAILLEKFKEVIEVLPEEEKLINAERFTT